jgi:putative flippase GtrA
MFDNQKIRYLLIGGINTVFGYFVTVFFYYSLTNVLHTLTILCLANVCAISFSFLTNKFFVFKTKGKWTSEYLRYFFVYGNTALIAILLTWILTDYTNIPFWLSQALILPFTVIVTYLSQKKYTFKS